MKSSTILAALLIVIVMGACSSGGESNNQEPDAVAVPEAEPEIIATKAVCVWDQVSVRATPGPKGKWLTSISAGEILEYLGGDTTVTSDKKRTYTQVRLSDGTEGWSQKDFIIENGEVAVFLENNVIYKRPDLLTKSDKSFSQMDIVAIKSVQDDWVEVTGKRKEGTWLDSGWLKGSKLSKDATDVAVAKFGPCGFRRI